MSHHHFAEQVGCADQWHPAIRQALDARPRLAQAYDDDPLVHQHVHQLNTFLLALANHMPDRWLAEQMLAELLPADDVLVRLAYERERALREATMRMPGVPDVHLTEPDHGVQS